MPAAYERGHFCNLTSNFCNLPSFYNPLMPLIDQIQKDIVAAMKAREEQRLSCLRMVKTALKNREIEKMAPLDDKESQQVLSTLIKQRKDSVEQFTKGGRQEMADKETAEIKLIEGYLPKAAGRRRNRSWSSSGDRRDNASARYEGYGDGHEGRHGPLRCRRDASGWQGSQRGGEEGVGGEVGKSG